MENVEPCREEDVGSIGICCSWENTARRQQGEACVGRDGGWEKGQGCREGEALRDSGHQGGQ